MNEIISSASSKATGRTRLLVVIASYGSKNLGLLKQIIDGYQHMSLDVDVMVVSNDPKDLGPAVNVVVGLPIKNPWSLPFAHKPIFAENLEKYDLFAYSEDDMGVSERNILAFVDATRQLATDEIAGFLRYELDEAGLRSYPDVHAGYHWKRDSVRRRGEHVIAEFTNEHAAFYVLTKDQLLRAIASGGFVRAPYEGQHDMLCSAATDPYTSCGFRKVICVSSIGDFTIHHKSNRYAGQVGASAADFNTQVDTLIAIAKGAHPVSSLLDIRSTFPFGLWAKGYYERPREALLGLVPSDVKTVLSVGSGSGEIELTLKNRGLSVTALPLDSIIGSVAAKAGIDVLYGTFDECVASLDDRVFDCVVITDLLHLLPNPGQLIEKCSRLVRKSGTLLIGGPNFSSVKVIVRRVLQRSGYRALGSFARGGVQTVGPTALKRALKKSGLRVDAVRWIPAVTGVSMDGRLGRLRANSWLLRART